ncbi:hypothetical protein FNV43_RR05098 [Rhamnella rubrinervis]|uniref:Uncharacterized protein n=1 Tax=Rhamnella rubrinervis TaxID=2594499 RepID=A0A8K0HN29_9ROSA|nr:hypothetical protein FNV43_RR05098 [Rhamnella rubrinervis]
MAITTSSVYVSVIEDVISKVRDEFMNNGGDDVLKELQGTWEAKMMQAGVVNAPIERSSAQKPTPGGPITPVHDLNVPYEGSEEYETPTAEILFPPTPLQTPIQTPLPGTGDNAYNIPTGPNDYPASGNDNGGGSGGGGGNTEKSGSGRPSPYMQPPSPWMNQRAPLDVNIAYVEGRDEVDRGTSNQPSTQDFFLMSGKRKREDFTPQYSAGGFIPQQDGAGDATPVVFEIEVSEGSTFLGRTANNEMSACVRASSKIPQLDGPIPEPYDDALSTPNIFNYQGVVYNEDYNIANTPAPNDLPVSTPVVPAPNDVGEDDDDDEPLNEDDDDEPDDVDSGEDLNTQHLVLAQFDKVTRTKSRWKCTLKDGIMHINNKDVLFNKATGEFDF